MKINTKISIPLKDNEVEEIQKHISIVNDSRINSKTYSTRAQWLREAIQDKILLEKEKIDALKIKTNSNYKIEEEIDDINKNLIK